MSASDVSGQEKTTTNSDGVPQSKQERGRGFYKRSRHLFDDNGICQMDVDMGRQGHGSTDPWKTHRNRRESKVYISSPVQGR